MDLKWSKKDNCSAYGRNGGMWMRGIAIEEPSRRGQSDRVNLRVINSRGISYSIRMQIPIRAIPALIKVLQEVMLRHDGTIADIQIPEIKSTP